MIASNWYWLMMVKASEPLLQVNSEKSGSLSKNFLSASSTHSSSSTQSREIGCVSVVSVVLMLYLILVLRDLCLDDDKKIIVPVRKSHRIISENSYFTVKITLPDTIYDLSNNSMIKIPVLTFIRGYLFKILIWFLYRIVCAVVSSRLSGLCSSITYL